MHACMQAHTRLTKQAAEAKSFERHFTALDAYAWLMWHIDPTHADTFQPCAYTHVRAELLAGTDVSSMLRPECEVRVRVMQAGAQARRRV